MTAYDGGRRIHIVGGPGSGKTTLAIALARRLALPVHDLDDFAQGVAPDFRPVRPLATRRTDVRRLSDRPSWVTEGSFLWWTDTLFEQAQTIVWLDVPWTVAARRVLLRHLRSYVSDIARASGAGSRLRALRHPHARHLVSFMRWASRYYRTPARMSSSITDPEDIRALTRAATAAHLARYRSKVVRVQTADVDRVMAALDRSAHVSRNLQLGSHSPTRPVAHYD